jgi:hypothetical protein
LLGGAISSALPSGLFLSSIFGSVAGRGEGDGVVATGIRKRPHEPATLRKGALAKGCERLRMIEMPKSKRLVRVTGCGGLAWVRNVEGGGRVRMVKVRAFRSRARS